MTSQLAHLGVGWANPKIGVLAAITFSDGLAVTFGSVCAFKDEPSTPPFSVQVTALAWNHFIIAQAAARFASSTFAWTGSV